MNIWNQPAAVLDRPVELSRDPSDIASSVRDMHDPYVSSEPESESDPVPGPRPSSPAA